MNTIKGIDAIRKAREVCKLPDGSFKIAFFKYDRNNGKASARLQVRDKCTIRSQLPQDVVQVPSDNYFLFKDKHGEHKTAFRVLVRFIGFPPDYKLLKVKWF